MSEYYIPLCTEEFDYFYLCVFRLCSEPSSHRPSRLRAGLLSRVQWLDWRFVMSLSFSLPSRAVIPLDPQ